jgi:hypothetical protein
MNVVTAGAAIVLLTPRDGKPLARVRTLNVEVAGRLGGTTPATPPTVSPPARLRPLGESYLKLAG